MKQEDWVKQELRRRSALAPSWDQMKERTWKKKKKRSGVGVCVGGFPAGRDVCVCEVISVAHKHTPRHTNTPSLLSGSVSRINTLLEDGSTKRLCWRLVHTSAHTHTFSEAQPARGRRGGQGRRDVWKEQVGPLLLLSPPLWEQKPLHGAEVLQKHLHPSGGLNLVSWSSKETPSCWVFCLQDEESC